MKTKEEEMESGNKEEISAVDYITDEDKRELVFQWLAREWKKEGESAKKTEL